MDNRVIQIQKANGDVLVRTAPDDASVLLSDWLESSQLPLNTRCGGRGLCRGCHVKLDGQLVQACQTTCQNVESIGIPEASVRDHSLSGVSSFEIGAHSNPPQLRPGIGLALDIGTTTVAAALWDLSSGTCLVHGSVANEQRRFGDNVLSRIDHAITEGGGAELQLALVRDTLEPLLRDLCQEAKVSMEKITESIATGNTVMLHAFAGVSLSGLATYPFQPVFLDAQNYSTRTLGLSVDFPVTLAANLGPFVGADIAVGAMVAGMLEHRGNALLIDFGTNGEIMLKHPGGYLATATAAGPAFEGGRLRCGTPAREGVVSGIARDANGWQLQLSGGGKANVKANVKTNGLSGAAYVDFLAHACQQGLLSSIGRLSTDHPEVESYSIDDENGHRVKLGKSLFVTEIDIAELIQAKAAIAAGIMTLLELADLKIDAIETLYIAGGFGYHLNCPNAMAVGLMPTLPMERVSVIGNASLGGASLLLQSSSSAAIEELKAKCTVVELNQIESFEDHFIDSMPLAQTGTEL